jgi:pyruvate formate lyase activating enzyme
MHGMEKVKPEKDACPVCGQELPVSGALGACGRCLAQGRPELLARSAEIHARFRLQHGLPPSIPRHPEGIACGFCGNDCRLGPEEFGYCGVRRSDGRAVRGGVEQAAVSWYHDPLPTNCVADWVCPAGTGAGYPRFAHRPGPEHGYTNLAVFYRACTFHCLNCQNWHFRETDLESEGLPPAALAQAVDERTACICYFGGDPTPFLPHSLAASRLARRNHKGILRICWETNGSMRRSFLQAMAKLALESGGVIKFDLKALSENLHRALTGVSNHQTLSNFQWLAQAFPAKRPIPLLVASTLLIPGLIEPKEVRGLARFIADCNPQIPYALLAFHPDCRLRDLPPTSRRQAEACLAEANAAGLKEVRLGNVHLLH